MPRFKIVLYRGGQRVVVSYGWSPLLGFFLAVIRGGRKEIDYDIVAEGYDGLAGLLRSLVSTRIVPQDAVDRALELMPVVEDVADIEDDDARLVATIVTRVKDAAGE